jgi:hypothetical protein
VVELVTPVVLVVPEVPLVALVLDWPVVDELALALVLLPLPDALDEAPLVVAALEVPLESSSPEQPRGRMENSVDQSRRWRDIVMRKVYRVLDRSSALAATILCVAALEF